jgi:putative MFS transporter
MRHDLEAAFLSSTFLGLMVGAWAAGPISDRYGRRMAYQINLLMFGLGSLARGVARRSISCSRNRLQPERAKKPI